MIKAKQDLATDVRHDMYQGKGRITFKHIATPAELDGKCRLFAKLQLEPNASIGSHKHQDEEEIFYVLDGAGLMIIDGTERLIAAGDVVITKGGSTHSIENPGASDLELVAVILTY